MTNAHAASKTYQRLLAIETDATSAPDKRRMMSEERQRLHVAIDKADWRRASELAEEAERVIEMWEGY